MAQSDFYGWTLVAAFWVIVFINLAFAAYGAPVMNGYMAADFHLSRKAAGLPYAVYTVMSGVPGPLVALCIARIGVRRTVVLGSLLLVAGSVAMATLVHGITGAVICAGVIIGLGVVSGGPIGIQPGVAQWFVRRRALALAIVYSAGGVGGFVAAQWVLNPVITAYGGNWRAGWWVMAALAGVAAVIAALFIRDRPADLGQVPDGVREPAAAGAPSRIRPAPSFITQEAWSFGEVLHSGRFWIMVLALCGGSAGYTLMLAQGWLHLTDLGHSAAERAAAVSTMTGSTLLGKLALASFGDRFDPRYIWAIATVALGGGLILVVDAHSTASLYICAVSIGFGFGGALVCMMTVLSNYYGTRAFAAAAGVAAALNTAVSFFGPVIGGLLYDRLGTYAPAFYSLAGWCFLGALALWLVRPPVRGRVAGTAAALGG
jgi:MFS family permease